MTAILRVMLVLALPVLFVLHIRTMAAQPVATTPEVTEPATAQSPGPDPGTICGATDDRALSSDSRVGRLSFVTSVDATGTPTIASACTAWLIANGTVLTAGHCVDLDPDQDGSGLPDGVLDLDDNDLVEFGPPPSTSMGVLQPAPPEQRYAIDLDSVAWAYEGEGESLGDDWAVFRLLPNDVTGRLAGNVQGGFRVSNSFPAIETTVRITGHGTDGTPDSTRNQVQQTHTGPLVYASGFGDAILSYRADTTPGNSGSPIIWQANQYALGIHTTGGCEATGGSNSGTGLNHFALRAAVDTVVNGAENYEGNGTLHVDHSVLFPANQTGSLFRPYTSLMTAAAAASDGQKISLMAGAYDNDTPLLDKALLIVAPVGPAVIGQ